MGFNDYFICCSFVFLLHNFYSNKMQEKKTNLSLIFSVVGAVVGVIGVVIAYRQYVENKEIREIQKRLSILQLEKAEAEKKQSAG